MKISKKLLLLWILLFQSPLFADEQSYDIPGSDPKITNIMGAQFWISTYVNQFVDQRQNNQKIILIQDGKKVTLLYRAFDGFIIIE